MKTIRLLTVATVLMCTQVVYAQSYVWEYRTSIDEITDEVTYMASSYQSGAILLIACGDTEVMVTVALGESGAVSGEKRIGIYRFNKQKPVTLYWINIAGGFTLAEHEALEFVRQVAKASTVIIRSKGKTVKFSLHGAERVLKNVARKCPALQLEDNG